MREGEIVRETDRDRQRETINIDTSGYTRRREKRTGIFKRNE